MANASAWSQGWAIGQGAAQHSRDRKEMLSDEERQQKASDLISTRNGILTKLPTLLGPNGEKTPEYEAAYQQLTQAQQGLGQLYHPDKDPSALQKDWHFLLEKMHGITGPKDKSPSSTTSETPAIALSAPAAPITNPAIPLDDAIDQHPVAATTVPGMGVSSLNLPAGPSVSVTKAPAPSWGQAQKLKQQAASMQKAQDQVTPMTAGMQSPEQQAAMNSRIANAELDAKIDHTMVLADKLGLSEESKNELKQQMLGLKNVAFKPLPGAAGQPWSPDGGKTFLQNGSGPDGSVITRPMPKEYKPNSKAVRGNLVNTKEHGWIMPWLDPFNPNRVIGYQKVTPPRGLQGTTRSGSATDAYGVTTSSSSTTNPTSTTPQDFNFSGIQELPQAYNGEDLPGGSTPAAIPPVAGGNATTSTWGTPAASGSPNKAPVASSAPPHSVAKPTTSGVTPPTRTKVGATPAQLRSQIPVSPKDAPPVASPSGQFQVDGNGHIPDADIQKYGLNRNLVQLANSIMDGADVTKIGQKDSGAARDLAQKYGWQGQGLFSPKEKLLLKESATYLDKAITDPSMKVLDSKESRVKIANALHAAQDNSGIISKAMAVQFGLTPEENNFVSTYLQLIGTISGLGQLTRGGRMTEATAKRLMNELPSPLLTPNSAAGVDKLKRLRSEIDVATQKGSFDLNSNSGGMGLDDFIAKHKLPPIKK